MKKFSSIRKGLAVSVVAALALSACSGGGDDKADGGPDSDGIITVKLGIVGPKTGPAVLYYKNMEQVVETYGDEFEKRYGVRFKAITEDDQGKPEEAARAVSRLINEEGVDALMGPAQSGNALQVADVVQRSQLPWLLSGTSADEIINYDIQPNWAFMTNFTNQQQAAVLGERLFANDQKVGVVYSADAFGQSNLAHISAWAKENGHEITEEQPIQSGAADANAIIKRFQSAGVNSVFMGITQGADIATVTRAIEQAGYEPTTTLTTGTILSDYSDLAEPSQWKNIQIVDPRNILEGSAAEILQQVRDETGEEPAVPILVVSVYAMLDIYSQAVQQVGNATDREAVRQAMEDIEKVHLLDEVHRENPFTPTDHTLYDDNPENWTAFGFDEKFNMVRLGTAAECIENGC